MANVEVLIPDIGDFTEVDVIEVSVKVGDLIEKEAPLITLETDKAAMEIPSPYSGRVTELKTQKGDKVSEGHVILTLETEEAVVEKAKSTEKASASEKTDSVEKINPSQSDVGVEKKSVVDKSSPTSLPFATSEKKQEADKALYAGPGTRRMARELGVDLSYVQGTGRKGRVLTKDVANFVKTQMSSGNGGGVGISLAAPVSVDYEKFGPVEVKPLNRIKKLSGQYLHRNWVSIPHVTHFEQADITELENFRRQNKSSAEAMGIRLTPLVFFIKAAVASMRAFPQFNASLSPNGEELVYKKYFHIGVAVDTPNGLVVPVVRDVETKGIYNLANELIDLSQKARDGTLKAAEMQGTCFTISSLGGIGGTQFTPIINAPDVAILGISKAQVQPVYQAEKFVPRTMLPLSLSYDHRVIDGAEAARFMVHYKEQLQDIRRLLL